MGLRHARYSRRMRPARTGASALALSLLVTALVGFPAPGAHASAPDPKLALPSVPPPCGVKNLRTGRTYRGTGSNLQTAIDAAGAGSRLRIRGVCSGTFSIARSLKLIGEGNAAYPAPTLNGRHRGTVLTIHGSATTVLLKSLTVTRGVRTPYASPRGLGRKGGGIQNWGILTLTDSSVTHNEGFAYGGGILNSGTLTLNGSSTVAYNHVEGAGAGIANLSGILTLNDSSSVRGNVAADGGAPVGGAGIYNQNGTIVMNDSSVIAGNTSALGYGGGLVNAGRGRVTMNGSSAVRENRTLEGGGGGIANGPKSILTLNDGSSVSSNVVAKSGYPGGGIDNYQGLITLNGSSSVTGNTTAGGFGAGIDNYYSGLITLNGSSSVTENTIAGGGPGGGIYSPSSAVAACPNWTGAISPNTPDDPPAVTPITCQGRTSSRGSPLSTGRPSPSALRSSTGRSRRLHLALRGVTRLDAPAHPIRTRGTSLDFPGGR